MTYRFERLKKVEVDKDELARRLIQIRQCFKQNSYAWDLLYAVGKALEILPMRRGGLL